jgi:predicted NBD/HSP70 family sugar kinase
MSIYQKNMSYLVIDFGGTSIKFALMNYEGEILQRSSIEAVSDDLSRLLSDLTSAITLYQDSFQGIALSMPGRVNAAQGLLFEAGALKCLNNFMLVDWFKQTYHVPCHIENDANCVALAQLWRGPVNANKDFICLVFGTGIGGAIVIDRKIYRGFHDYSGEFGYMILQSGDQTKDYWTWEELDGSTKSFVEYLRQLKPSYRMMSGQELFDSTDDDLMRAKVRYFMQIAAAIYSLQMIMDPECFVIGGGISSRKDLIEAINQAVDLLVAKRPIPFVPKIYSCVHLADANLIGALYNYLQREQLLKT